MTSDQITDVQPEVAEFMTQVRQHLLDLDPEELQDLTEGLQADLSDLVAERGPDALGDPGEYARELRTAAGLESVMQRVRTRRPLVRSLGGSANDALDAVHGGWDHAMAALPGRPMDVVETLRPVWWIFRGWVAVQLLAALAHGNFFQGAAVVPHLRGFGWPVLALAVLASIQVGRGRWWPGPSLRRTPPSAWLRLLLLGLNVSALLICVAPIQAVTASNDTDVYGRGFDQGFNQGTQERQSTARKGLYVDGTWVSNIYPYDAAGRPLVGVQLFNQIGQPINVVSQAECAYAADGSPNGVRIYYPWSNGSTQTHNVYPVPSRVQASENPDASAFNQANKPVIGQFPRARVPGVSLPGITASQTKGTASYVAGVPKSLDTSAAYGGC